MIAYINRHAKVGEVQRCAPDSKQEYLEVCRDELLKKKKLIPYDYALADGGKLPCKKVLQILGPAWYVEDKTLPAKVLKDIIEKCLEVADEEKFVSVSIPAFYPGSEDAPLQLYVQSYVQALATFSEHVKHVQKLYIVENQHRQFADLKDMIESAIKERSDTSVLGTNANASSVDAIEMDIRNVKIRTVLGTIESKDTDAIVCTENKAFKDTSRIAKAILKLVDEDFREAYERLPTITKRRNRSVGAVFETRVTGRQLRCRYVLHTIVPRRNRDYCRNTSRFEEDIRKTVRNVLQKAAELHCSSVAIPLFGTTEDEKVCPTPVETCCREMLRGIEDFVGKNDSTVIRIDLVSISNSVLKAFDNAIQELKLQEHQETFV